MSETQCNRAIDKKQLLLEFQSEADEFGGVHTTISKQIAEIINTINLNKKSCTLGLFGKWGTGKSFIVDKLDEYLDKNKATLVVIDSWKYNKQSFLRATLREVCKQGIKAETFLTKELERVNRKLYSTENKDVINFSWIYWISATVFLIATSYAFYHNGIHEFYEYVAPPLLSIILAFIFKEILLKFFFKVKNYTQKELFSDEQFEDEFDNLLNKLQDDQKLVIVFDNIDRCTPENAYLVLSAVKTYLDKKRCFYIIPCDDEAIIEYLDNELFSNCNNQKGRDFIEKLFNSFIRLPLIKRFERDKYIRNKISELDLELGQIETDKLVDVLNHGYKGQTPRNIKRFLNDFAMYFYIAKNIDKQKQFLLKDIAHFAIMITIKQLYPKFENELAKDTELINKYFDHGHKLTINIKKCCPIDGKSSPEFIHGSNAKVLYEDLYEFLHKTERHFCQDVSILSFLYLKELGKDEDEKVLYEKLDNEEYIDIYNGNYETVINHIKNLNTQYFDYTLEDTLMGLYNTFQTLKSKIKTDNKSIKDEEIEKYFPDCVIKVINAFCNKLVELSDAQMIEFIAGDDLNVEKVAIEDLCFYLKNIWFSENKSTLFKNIFGLLARHEPTKKETNLNAKLINFIENNKWTMPYIYQLLDEKNGQNSSLHRDLAHNILLIENNLSDIKKLKILKRLNIRHFENDVDILESVFKLVKDNFIELEKGNCADSISLSCPEHFWTLFIEYWCLLYSVMMKGQDLNDEALSHEQIQDQVQLIEKVKNLLVKNKDYLNIFIERLKEEHLSYLYNKSLFYEMVINDSDGFIIKALRNKFPRQCKQHFTDEKLLDLAESMA